MISYGVESGSQTILNALQKGIDIAQVEETVRRTKEAGIRAKGLFMIGHPLETAATLRETLELVLRCPFDEINLSYLTPFPGTEIYGELRGRFDEEWTRMNALTPLLRPQDLSVDELREGYSKIVRRFYMRPSVTKTYGRILLRSGDNRARLIKGFSRWLLSPFRSRP